MPFGPIFRSTLRNPTGAILIAIQIALTLAIASNMLYMVKQRLDTMNTDTGLVDSELLTARVFYFGKVANKQAQADIDRKTLLEIPGVKSVSYSDSISLGSSNSTSSLCFSMDADADDCPHSPSVFRADANFHHTVGLQLREGRWLNDSDAAANGDLANAQGNTMMLSAVLADTYFPSGRALGQQLYLGGRALTVVGVYERMLRPSHGGSTRDHTVLAAERRHDGYLTIRVETDRLQQVKATIEATMVKLNDQRVISEILTFDEMAERRYRRDQAMVVLLLSVVVMLVLITALGVGGLVSFTVANRKKQIGTRRALGASKTDILRYFLAENLSISAVALVLGCALAVVLNQYLLQNYQLERLPLAYLAPAALGLLAIAQLATLFPALRASQIAPAIATRTV